MLSRSEISVSPSPVEVLWSSGSDSLGIPSPFAVSPGWEAWCGAQHVHSSGRTSLVLLFSSLWITHPAGMGLILLYLYSSFHLVVVSSLSLAVGYLFFLGGGSQHPPVNGCSTAGCNFCALTGDEYVSFYAAIFNWTLH